MGVAATPNDEGAHIGVGIGIGIENESPIPISIGSERDFHGNDHGGESSHPGT